MAESIYYVYGDFVEKSEAKLCINDLGFVRAYSAYECLRTYGDRLFHLTDHLNRLKVSCEELRITYPSADIAQILHRLVEKNFTGSDLMLRIYVTAGLEVGDHSELFILVDPAPMFPAEYYSKGISVITTPAGRMMAPIKSTQYANAMILLKVAQEQKAQDVLYIDEKRHVLELTKANFFAVRNDVLVTPEIDILPGITRKVVLQLAEKMGLKTEVRPVAVEELANFDEAFLTSTMKELMPITKIDGFEIRGKSVIEQIREVFDAYKVSRPVEESVPALV